ncbi:hypothetical protein ACH5RR_025160 [Cinchona calisaya]|uniref:TITAN-like protein n=1 Tax=Cinchona calisaya TaxID=153742 RepID=A0ABD2YYU0_9GENT
MPIGSPNPNPNNQKKKKTSNDDNGGGEAAEEEKQLTEFEYCKVCKLNHNKGRRHIYFPNHKKALSSFLSRFQFKIKNDVAFYLKNPIPLRPEHASLNRLWCVFCDLDILESGSSVACGNAIAHLGSAEHLKEVKSFLWKYGGGMDRLDLFRISDSDFAKWEKKCKLLKTEAAGEGSHGSLIGPSNYIHHNETKSNYVNNFKINDIDSSSVDFKFPNGVVPLQDHTNERSQGLHSNKSRVGPHHMLAGTNVDLGARSPNSLPGSFGNQRSILSVPEEYPTYCGHTNGSVCPYERITAGDRSSEGTLTSEGSSHNMLNLSQISSSAQEDGGGNVHSGAPPPWFSATERIQLDNTLNQGRSNLFSSLAGPVKSSKLNPKRVGAAWAERRKIELELEKRGELARHNFDADWLPNFGRVWQSGSRKESRKEFLGEKKTGLKVVTQIEKPNELQPYISKRMRRDTSE